MERWTCPKCKREFGRKNQGHMCSRGLTVDEYFASANDWERPIFDTVSDHLQQLGDVIVDPVAMGIMFKNGPMLCELRAKNKWTAVGFFLRRRLTSARLSRKVTDYQGKYFHVVNIDDATMVDDELLGWLTEAYHVAGGDTEAAARAAAANGGDSTSDPNDSGPGDEAPMVPDDIEDPFA